LQIQIRRTNGVTILEVSGPLYLGTPERTFRETVQQMLDAGTRALAINLARVPRVDSAGIGVLVRTHASLAKAGGKCHIFAPPKMVLETLKMVRLDTVLDLFEDEVSALAGF
jgi:anti-sigma B factor antagonist